MKTRLSPTYPSHPCSARLLGLWIVASLASLPMLVASQTPAPEGTATPAETATVTEIAEPAAKTLYLIRHGEYDHDDERDPEVGKGLVPLGVAQARLISARLAGLPVDFSVLHSSPMTRARQTASVIAEDLGMEMAVSNNLRECTPPTWREDIMAGESPEDLAACKKQIDEAFEVLAVPAVQNDSHEIVVGHGNVIRAFVTRALGVDALSWLGMSIGNCSLTILHVNADGSMKVLAYSDLGHIPPNLQTRTTPGQPRDLSIP